MVVPCRAAVLGSPVAHSLSPVLHRAAYAALGLDHWTYTAIECDEAGLPPLLASCDSAGPGSAGAPPGGRWAGLSLTMPLKRAVLPLLDRTEPLAVEVGGANTVVFADGQRHGYNTDVPGMVAALAEAGITSPPGAGVTSPLAAGVTSPLAAGVTSPLAAGVTSPLAAGVTSPLAAGVTSPPAAGVTSPLAAGVTSPLAAGVTSPLAAGVTSPLAAGVTSPLAAGVTSPVGATILGAGATACAALAALRAIGLAAAVVQVRDRARAGDLLAAARRLGLAVELRPFGTQVRDGDLLISTVPAGAADFYAERAVDPRARPCAVLDVVYSPWPTALAIAAAQSGVVVVSGFDLLLHQAARQVELMTGLNPAPLEPMRAAGQSELSRRAALSTR